MGMFATVYVEDGVQLPHFPESIDKDELSWQSKEGLDVYGGPYRITNKGRLERKENTHREKTEEEKQKEARRWGFDSWSRYVEAYDNMDDGELYPSEIDPGENEYPPTVHPYEKTVDEVWWADHNMHGTFEFHQIIKRNPIDYETFVGFDGQEDRRPTEYELDVYIEYEARFTRGELDEIVFLGERTNRNSVQETIEKIQSWERDK